MSKVRSFHGALAGACCLAWLASAQGAESGRSASKPSAGGSDRRPDPALSLAEAGKPVEQVVAALRFADGAAGDGQGNVYLADVPAGRILRLSAAGRLSIFRDGAAAPSGLSVAPNGDVVVCEIRGRSVVAIDSGGFPRVLADAYQGRKLNSPRCAWADAKGGVYFTDPHLDKSQPSEQGGEYVYYLGPDAPGPVRVAEDLPHPSAVVGTPDGAFLYISDTLEGRTWRFRVLPDGRLAGKQMFANLGAGGIVLDERGNVYLMGTTIRVHAPTGAFIEELRVPGAPSSGAFGGEDGRTLFVTTNWRSPEPGAPPGRTEMQGGLYAIPMKVHGAVRPAAPPVP